MATTFTAKISGKSTPLQLGPQDTHVDMSLFDADWRKKLAAHYTAGVINRPVISGARRPTNAGGATGTRTASAMNVNGGAF